MYKVFRDPEGKRSLDHTDTPHSSTNKTPTVQQSDELETYKLRIQTLNFEIKRLNDELEMVIIFLVYNLCKQLFCFSCLLVCVYLTKSKQCGEIYCLLFVLLQSKSGEFSTNSLQKRADMDSTLLSQDLMIGDRNMLPQEQS